jgi:hypothetical protein
MQPLSHTLCLADPHVVVVDLRLTAGEATAAGAGAGFGHHRSNGGEDFAASGKRHNSSANSVDGVRQTPGATPRQNSLGNVTVAVVATRSALSPASPNSHRTPKLSGTTY